MWWPARRRLRRRVLPATASAAEVNIGNLSSATSFGQFSGTFGGVSVSKVDLTGDTLQGVASTLQSALRSADGNSKNISVTLNGLNLEFRDAAGRGTASNFAWTAATAAAPATSVVPAPDNLINGSLATPAAGAAATASTAVVSVNNLGQGNNFSSFSGTFGGVSISNVDLTGAATLQTVAANLQAALRSADGNSKNISVSASGANLTFADAAGRGTLTGPAWTMNPANTQPTTGTTDPIVSTVSLTAGAKATPAAGAKAVASSAQVEVDGLVPGNNFSSFSGSFGGVSVNNVDLTAAASWQSLASTLQSALRSADGNSTNISVTANGANIEFSDAAGRGTATGFTWTTNSANAQGEPNVSNPTNLVTGSKATPASAAASGPAVAQPSFIKTVVQKYLESQFETVIGNTSNALEEARYAQQNLPSITNWYSVIASPPLAAVVQTVLGLPSSFGAVDVDVQAQTLAQRMNIKDFQNPAKLATMLNQFVAMSSETAQVSPTSAALQILSSTPSASGIINLTLPTGDSFSSASMSALLLG